MAVFILTCLVLMVCMAALASGLLLAGKPLQKHCGEKPDQECSCGKGPRGCKM